jgi:hypothetical protein
VSFWSATTSWTELTLSWAAVIWEPELNKSNGEKFTVPFWSIWYDLVTITCLVDGTHLGRPWYLKNLVGHVIDWTHCVWFWPICKCPKATMSHDSRLQYQQGKKSHFFALNLAQTGNCDQICFLLTCDYRMDWNGTVYLPSSHSLNLSLLVAILYYCRINSSVMHHEGYLTCWNMVVVTGHEGILMKGPNHDNQPNMAILALVAYPRYEFDTKQHQSVQLNSYNW